MIASSFFDPDKQSKRNSVSIQSIIILGGSQGSTRLFNFVLSLVPEYPNITFRVILGTKNADFQSKFAKFPHVEIFNFVSQDDMQYLLRMTDAAITRAGATSLAELDAMGLSLFIVPLKESANDHQRANAFAYQNK
jgi:UDP-N-acetylglucosamine--N-acetylmuramyl-(pentapeptide) pyrophosphoryl-undecaprenol N-acetylglucosamine transferase